MERYRGLTLEPYDQSRESDPTYRAEWQVAYNRFAGQQVIYGLLILAEAPDDPQLGEILRQIAWHITPDERTAPSTYVFVRDYVSGKTGRPRYGELLFTQMMMAARIGDAAEIQRVLALGLDAPISREIKADLLSYLAGRGSTPQERREGYGRVVREFDGTASANMSRGKLRLMDAIGTPFELEFDDAMTGRHVAIRDFRGKLVVIDFWATWCGPCIGELPAVQAAYDKFHGRGVEFVAISLDHARGVDLETMKRFVRERRLPWPQYYEPKDWFDGVAAEWGIDGIPHVIILDREGRVAVKNAVFKLDARLTELLDGPTTRATP
jgi:thiol-disulfide isomerase/thioredoxin